MGEATTSSWSSWKSVKTTTQMRTGRGCSFRACYSEGVSHRRLHLEETQKQEGELCSGKRTGFRGAPKLLAQGSWSWANRKGGVLWDWLGVQTWLLLISPELAAGAKIREGVSYWSSPGLLGPVVIVGFPWLVAADGGSESCFSIWSCRCPLYIQSLTFHIKFQGKRGGYREM